MHLIVGATGSLGGTIAKLLRERGEAVRALVRPTSPARQGARHTTPEDLAATYPPGYRGDPDLETERRPGTD